jgi:ABC-type iron transport system FetAB permease component
MTLPPPYDVFEREAVQATTRDPFSLGTRHAPGQMATKRDQVELRLARGATWKEAVNDSVLRNALTAALTPSINALSVTGIVHIPRYETK